MHPDFEPLSESWELSLSADGYAPGTIRAYLIGLTDFGEWLAKHHPDIGPLEADRDHTRGWVIHKRDATTSGTARSQFAGIRHFARWLVTEKERATDFTDGVRTPRPNEARTPVLTLDQIRAMLNTCSGESFMARRDKAIIYVFADGGVRLAECAGLMLDDFDVRQRMLYVAGKGSNLSGPRHRAVPLGVKASRAIDRYVRERRKHPYAELPQLWLGARNRGALSQEAIKRVLITRGAQVGVKLHPHMFRHSWASEFRRAGGSEGDLMILGGWRSRTMLDRYGKAVAEDRAADAYRQRALGDRL
jgi:site-specific recombinase XerD